MKGHATTEDTAAYAARFADISFQIFGKTGWSISPAGFGCYRVGLGIPQHEQALRYALCSGVNLIDTSANYGDGLSEKLVGKVLANLVETGELAREAVVVVSKAGYLQGQNHALSQHRKTEGNPFPDLVTFGPDLEHCIHPEFLEDQLTRSLERLGLETLDALLLHNPEYYLSWTHRQGATRDEAQAEYYRRIEAAFRHLETEVARGRIASYGISSNTFPGQPGEMDFTSLKTVWSIALKMEQHHHFRVIQFPMNLLERGAAVHYNQGASRTLLDFCRIRSLGVLINRPLNAILDGRLARLAEVETYVPRGHPQYQALAQQCQTLKKFLAKADADWAGPNCLSQMALRALRTTAGIHCVLVGMRAVDYVDDVLTELKRPAPIEDRQASWRALFAE